MRPTRLLTVADHLGAIGGAEIAQLRIIEGLASSGWDVDLLYVSPRGPLATMERACVEDRGHTGLEVAKVRTTPERPGSSGDVDLDGVHRGPGRLLTQSR